MPALIKDSAVLVSELVKKSPAELDTWQLSPALADLNAERFQDWEEKFTTENARPALLAFKGDVYVGMDVSRCERDFTRAQGSAHIVRTSWSPETLDLIQPYRLEMGTT